MVKKLSQIINDIYKLIRKKIRNYKTPRGKHRQNTLQHKSQQDLYDSPPRVIEIKAKINKWDLIKIKSFCTTKETISKVKDSLQNRRK